MFEVTAGRLASWTKGELIGGFLTARVSGVCVDSRRVKPGDLFIPLKGEHRDGHDYILSAVEAGASGFLTEKPGGDVSLAISRGAFAIEVESSLDALQRIAREYGRTLDVTVVGITGSTGKTTAREMAASVLRKRFKVVSSEKNFNNEIGLPLTILSAGPETEIVVVEMAMRGKGQIARLAEIARPQIGLVTGIGRAHLELLGTEKAIAEAKAELLRSLPADGAAALNADNPWTPYLAQTTSADVTTFGIFGGDLKAERIEIDLFGRPTFKIVGRGISEKVCLPVPGRHNAYNALAAASIASILGLEPSEIAVGLAETKLPEMRMEILTTAEGVTLLNDAYNANPESMSAGLTALSDMRLSGRRIAVLGDMLELGRAADECHLAIGREAADKKIDLLVTVGELGKLIAEGARRAGLDRGRVISFDSPEAAGMYLSENVKGGDAVLLKASRGVGLERAVEALLREMRLAPAPLADCDGVDISNGE